jgi:hypothetical protein
MEAIDVNGEGQEGAPEPPVEDANMRWEWVRRVFLDRR